MIDPVRARRRAAGAGLAVAIPVALAACGGEPVDTAGSPATPSVTPAACDIVSPAAVREALTPPPSASASASPSGQTPVAEPTPTGVYAVRQVSIGGRVNVPSAGTCTYIGQLGGQLVVAVLPKTTLAAVRAAQPDATTLGQSALLVSSTNATSLVVGRQGTVVQLTLNLGGADEATRANRLAAVAAALGAGPLPTLQPGASPTPGGTSATPAPVAAVGTVVTGQAAAQKVSEVDALKFQPNAVSLKSGDVVQWTNTGTTPHNVTFDDYPDLTSGTMNGNDVYQIKFTQAGTYSYHCTFHNGMDGQITVG